ncbi:MAG: hypothetical protein IKI11_09675 [Neisseriaceae bacterium]|nr:hypothetical protein [Neisseriaceae bacterium]
MGLRPTVTDEIISGCLKTGETLNRKRWIVFLPLSIPRISGAFFMLV